MVLNSFLPGKVFSEKEKKLMYCFQSKMKKELYFLFDEFVDINKTNILDALEEVGYRDTYRDEPYLFHAKLLEVFMTTAQGNIMSNIASSKLKTTFSASYILELLCERDSLLCSSEPEERMINLSKEPGKNEDTTNNHFSQKSKGINYLKPYLVDFLHEIHLKRDKKNVQESYYFSKYISRFAEVETKRLEQMESEEITLEFCYYFFDKTLNLIISYQEKYLINYSKNEKEFSDRIDNLSVSRLADALYLKFDFFKGKINEQQHQSALRFLLFHELNILQMDFGYVKIERLSKVEMERERIKSRKSLTASSISPKTLDKRKSNTTMYQKALNSETLLIKKEAYDKLWEPFRENFDDSKVLSKVISLKP
jgi:hypothetical protein